MNETIILTPAELAQIVASAVATALASVQRSRPMTPAEKQRDYRDRKRAASVTASVTREPESVTSVTEKVTREPGSVTDKVTLSPPSLPLSPQTPLSPAHPPTHIRACMRDGAEMLPFDDIPPPKEPPKRSTPPPLAEWIAYAATLSPRYEASDATNAWNHYEANGWRVGKNPVKDWRAACRTCHGRWLLSERGTARRGPNHGSAAQNAIHEYR